MEEEKINEELDIASEEAEEEKEIEEEIKEIEEEGGEKEAEEEMKEAKEAETEKKAEEPEQTEEAEESEEEKAAEEETEKMEEDEKGAEETTENIEEVEETIAEEKKEFEEGIKKIDKKLAELEEEKEEEKEAKEGEGEKTVEDLERELREIKKAPVEEEAEEEEEPKPKEKKKEEAGEKKEESKISTHLFALRTTANREDQVMDFVSSNAAKKKLDVYSVIRPHGMRGYIFMEAGSRSDAEQAAMNIPYARGILPNEINYSEIEHMLEQIKKEVNIMKNDIAEIIAGPFKREKCKITRVDKVKEEVVVELLEAAVPIPITVKLDAVKVIRREGEPEEGEE